MSAATVRTVVQHGPKDKKVAAFALDWPGWSRGAKTGPDAVELLEAYRDRYRPVARIARLEADFDAAGTLEVVEDHDGVASLLAHHRELLVHLGEDGAPLLGGRLHAELTREAVEHPAAVRDAGHRDEEGSTSVHARPLAEYQDAEWVEKYLITLLAEVRRSVAASGIETRL